MSLLFVFDMDDVLYRYDFRVRMAHLTEHLGYDLDELRRRWWHDQGELKAEAGGFADADEYLAAFQRAMGSDISAADWIRYRASAMRPDEDAIAAAARAGELGAVTLLTNNGPLLGKYLPQVAPLLVPIFGEHLHTSSEYGARKPDPAVFSRAIAAHGGLPKTTFFADDLLVNCEGARSIGVTAHHHEGDAGALLAAIEGFAASHEALAS
jgi:putative hydrolase of the HAD superfamily